MAQRHAPLFLVGQVTARAKLVTVIEAAVPVRPHPVNQATAITAHIAHPLAGCAAARGQGNDNADLAEAQYAGRCASRDKRSKHMTVNNAEFADRVQGRLDRLGLNSADLARLAGLPDSFICAMLDGDVLPPRGKRLIKLAEVLETSVSYLVGLDPDAPVPEEYLQEDQGSLGLLAGDEEALLRAYRRLDMSARAALLLIVLKMTPEPEIHQNKPRQIPTR